MPAGCLSPDGCRLANFLFPTQSFTMVWGCPIRRQNVKLFLRESLNQPQARTEQIIQLLPICFTSTLIFVICFFFFNCSTNCDGKSFNKSLAAC